MTTDQTAPLAEKEEASQPSGRDLILRAAARLFRAQGYAATSLRQIAAECGMKAGSIYYHFESKDEITAEVLHIGVAQVFDDVRRVTTELGSSAGAHELIRAGVLAHLKALHDTIEFSSANIRIFGQVPPDVRRRHMPLRRNYEAYWLSLFKRCQAAGALSPEVNLQHSSYLLLGAMNSTLDWFRAETMSIHDLATGIADLFLFGISDGNVPRP